MRYKRLLIGCAYILLPLGLIAGVITVDGEESQGTLLEQQLSDGDAVITRFTMNRLELGNTGLSMSSPREFTHLTQPHVISTVPPASDVNSSEYFQFENNGVNIEVDYFSYNNSDNISLQRLRSQYETEFEYLKEKNNIQYRFSTVNRSGIDGVMVKAEYPLEYLNKQYRFDVLTFVKSNRVWRVTARYKDCDQKGQALVRWMLESIQIVSHV